MKPWYLIFFVYLISVKVFAEGAEHEAGSGISEHQLKVIFAQTLNVSILIIGLIYFLNKPTKKFFREQKEIFLEAAGRAKKAQDDALLKNKEVEDKLLQLQMSSQESISRARAEAADLKLQLLVEAKEISNRIQSDAIYLGKIETEKAIAALRAQVISQATELARVQMSTKVSAEEHQKLQGDFIKNIKATL